MKIKYAKLKSNFFYIYIKWGMGNDFKIPFFFKSGQNFILLIDIE